MRAIFILILGITVGFTQAKQWQFVASSQAEFQNPHDVVLDPQQQYLYVSDLGHHMVQALDPKTLQVKFNVGKGQLSAPHDIAFDQKGQLYVADTGNDRIAIFTIANKKGKATGELKDPALMGPEGVDITGSRVYFTSTANHRIGYFDNGKLIKIIGEEGSGKNQFIRPHDIEVFNHGSQWQVYVGDPGNNRILWMDKAFNPIDELKHDFKEPKYLALDKKGFLYVADQHQNRLQIFNAQKKWISHITEGGGKKLNWIEGVEVVGNRMWIADTYNHRILFYEFK